MCKVAKELGAFTPRCCEQTYLGAKFLLLYQAQNLRAKAQQVPPKFGLNQIAARFYSEIIKWIKAAQLVYLET